jgi:hypothetical protein
LKPIKGLLGHLHANRNDTHGAAGETLIAALLLRPTRPDLRRLSLFGWNTQVQFVAAFFSRYSGTA